MIATATAAKRIQAYKDLEILETAARQRLLAAVGYGGDVLDEDEGRDQRDQGLTPASGAKAVPDVEAVSVHPEEPAGSAASLGDATVSVRAAEGAAPAPSAAPASPLRAGTQPPNAPASPPASGTDAALGMLNRQIQHQAGLRGITVAPAASVAEARAMLKSLMEKAA